MKNKYQPKIENVAVPPVPPTPTSTVTFLPLTFTGTAVFTKRISYILAQTVELTIEDGIVVSQKTLNTPDVPASAIGAGNKALWNQFRGDK